jgi:hypothetical protein
MFGVIDTGTKIAIVITLAALAVLITTAITVGRWLTRR